MKVKELIAKLQKFDGELEVQIVSGIDNDIEQVKLRTIKVEGGFKDIVILEGWTPF